MAKRGLTEAAIAAEAAELAEEQTLDGVTIQALAARLGVRPSSLYNHVDGLGGVLRALTRLALNRLESTIRDAAVGQTKGDALRAIAVAYRQFARGNPQLYRAFIRSHSLEDPNVDEAGQSVIRVMQQVMQAYPALSAEDVSHFLRGFRSLLHGFVSLEGAGFFHFHESADLDKSFTLAVDGYIATLEERGPAKASGTPLSVESGTKTL